MKTKSRGLEHRIWTMAAIGFSLVVLLANAQTAKAQWTTSGGGDTYNTNSSGKVGIGTTSPGSLLDVNGGTTILEGLAATQVLRDTTATTQGVGGAMIMGGNYSGGYASFGAIKGYKENPTSTNYAGVVV